MLEPHKCDCWSQKKNWFIVLDVGNAFVSHKRQWPETCQPACDTKFCLRKAINQNTVINLEIGTKITNRGWHPELEKWVTSNRETVEPSKGRDMVRHSRKRKWIKPRVNKDIWRSSRYYGDLGFVPWHQVKKNLKVREWILMHLTPDSSGRLWKLTSVAKKTPFPWIYYKICLCTKRGLSNLSVNNGGCHQTWGRVY